MFEIGASLAAARRARGLAVRDAEQLTCLRAKYLTALEEERFEELPGRAYARAFLRTYAAALGLEADQFVAEFEAQQPEPEEEEEDGFDYRPRPRFRLPVSIPVLAALAVVALLAWSAWTSKQPASPPVQASPPPAGPPAEVRAQAKVVSHPAPAKKVVVHAARGPCWLEARRGSSSGPLIAQRTLAQGQTATFAAPRVWLRLGAPWNVVARRGTHVARGLSTTAPVDVML